MASPKIHQLDARHILCPMPVIKVQKLIEELGNEAVGDQIEAICTDPGSMYDVPAWAKVHGHKLVKTSEDDYEYRIVIEISATD